jgi:hypothetical protein
VKILVVGGRGRERGMIWRLRQSPRFEKFDTLMPEPQHVHGIFRVIPKLFNKFDTIHITPAALADTPPSLRFQLSKGSFPRAP